MQSDERVLAYFHTLLFLEDFLKTYFMFFANIVFLA
jgi:hypothetical protein